MKHLLLLTFFAALPLTAQNDCESFAHSVVAALLTKNYEEYRNEMATVQQFREIMQWPTGKKHDESAAQLREMMFADLVANSHSFHELVGEFNEEEVLHKMEVDCNSFEEKSLIEATVTINERALQIHIPYIVASDKFFIVAPFEYTYAAEFADNNDEKKTVYHRSDDLQKLASEKGMALDLLKNFFNKGEFQAYGEFDAINFMFRDDLPVHKNEFYIIGISSDSMNTAGILYVIVNLKKETYRIIEP